MLGIEFPELIVITVVALLVIGPEHLPKVARTMGHLWGRAQRYINGIKTDISRDMALEELRQLQEKTKQEVGTFEQSMKEAAHEWENEVKEFERDANATLQQNSPTELPSQSIQTDNPPKGAMNEELPPEQAAAPEQKNTQKS